MKKLITLLAVFTLAAAFTSLNGTWKNDPPHSQLTFTVTHLGIAEVSGYFTDFEATITSSAPDFSDAVVELNAKTGSINTRVEARDKHLKSPDFFDVEKFPAMTFKSTSLEKAGDNKFTLTGDLTLHGVTKKVTVDLLYKGTTENPMSKKPTAGFQVTGTIKRSDFQLGNSFQPPVLSDEVQIKADGEFLRQGQ